MARQQRQVSGTGIYHVMLRGNNHQDIFECREDYWKFLRLLRLQTFPEDSGGLPQAPHCIIYAYCLMPNHVHLLIRDAGEGISRPISCISNAYAQYYNKRYDHFGHLFQGRFKSEPVNDMAYFATLLRYIHQNPVAAGIVTEIRKYPWTSWCEYQKDMTCALPVCTTQHVVSTLPPEELSSLVNEMLPKSLNILDYGNDAAKRVSDDKVRDFVITTFGIDSAIALQHLPKEERNGMIIQMKHFGASIRQISRLTGISEGVIRKLK